MVKKINWKDFEIKDTKPNLIPNGWDSFEEYGSGENLATNWDFSDGLTGWGINDDVKREVVDGSLRIYDANGSFASVLQEVNIPEGDYTVRVKRNPKSNVKGVIRGIGVDDVIETMTDDVFEIEVNVLKRFRLYLYAQNEFREVVEGGEFWIDWVQITPKDNQHLVVEKTPLGNGLTRIQTWGGNDRIKIRYLDRNMLEAGKPYTTSFYMSKNTGGSVYLYQNIGGIIPDQELKLGFNTTHQKESTGVLGNVMIRSERISDNLDFIASDPQIVEGDQHNPALIVTELDNGQEHVQVYGAYPDTELVYKGGNAIIGEPYVIESEIENLGGQLQMETTLDSNGQVIDKGINQVNIKGTTDSKDFEIGVKLRDGTI